MKILFPLMISLLLTSAFAQKMDSKVNTVVLVHGAFADGSSWNKIIPLLHAQGLKVVSVQNPLTSLADDVSTAKRAIDMQPGNVLLVGHSWGGSVITEAGNNDKVAGLFYVAAFAPDQGQTSKESTKDFPAPPGLANLVADSGGFLTLNNEAMAKDFAQDLPASMTNIMMATQGPIQGKCFDDKITSAAWKNKPNWYIVSSEDHMIHPEAQKAFAKRMNATTKVLKSSHVPFLSKPRDVADAILSAVKTLNSNKERKSAKAF
jgi:pimeloyl-ACP methyl ester carboxylesterase